MTMVPDFRGRPTRAEIRLGALRRNFDRARKLAGPGVKVMAVVKADAYGHGMLRVASELIAQGADYLGVAIIEEAVALREAGFAAPILVFGSPPDDQIPLFARHGIDMAVVSASKARSAAAVADGRLCSAGLRWPHRLRLAVLSAQTPGDSRSHGR